MERIVNSLRAEAEEVQAYIDQIDAVRQACARAGEYRQAQLCLERVKEANMRFAALVQLHASRFNVEEKKRLREAQQLEVLETKKKWKESLKEYDEEAAQLLVQLDRQQLLEMQKESAAATRQHREQDGEEEDEADVKDDDEDTAVAASSKEVLALRDTLERLVQAQRYGEAEKVKRELAQASARHAAECRRQRGLRHQQRLHDRARELREQRSATETRLERGRQHLLRDRDMALAEQSQAHLKAVERLDAATAIARNVTTRVLAEQLESYMHDPVRGNNFFVRAIMTPVGGGGGGGGEWPQLQDDEVLHVADYRRRS